MKKVLFVAKVVRSHIATFHLPYLKMFKEMGWETAVAAHNDYDDPRDCVIPNCDTYFDVPFERFPVSPNNVTSYRQLKKIIDAGEYDIIHCHTPVSAMITRLAALSARKRGTKVIYTAHGFHFFKGAPLINWLLYFPVEWFLARYPDALITINKEDYARAQKFAAKKVCGNIPVCNGFPIHQLNNGDAQRLRQRLQQRNIRQTLGRLPFGDGLAADADALRQLRLGQPTPLSELPDGGPGDIGVHGNTSFLVSDE